MKIILRKTFINDFDNEFKRYSINHIDLIKKLKETNLINLKNPYVKIKTYINGISIRGIGILNEEKTLVPVFFVLKKEKKIGENLVLDKSILLKINNLFAKYYDDFQQGKYLEF